MGIKIVIISAISAICIFFRWFAFNRVDSVALEVSAVSFSFRVFETVTKYQSQNIAGKDILLCVLSCLLFVALSCFHHANYSTLYEKIKGVIDNAKPKLENDTEETKGENAIKREALDNTLPLARHAIFLSYSHFLENKLGFYIRRGKKDARENYAKLLNSLSKLSFKVQESDLLLSEQTQKGGLLSFLVLGIFSILLAILE